MAWPRSQIGEDKHGSWSVEHWAFSRRRMAFLSIARLAGLFAGGLRDGGASLTAAVPRCCEYDTYGWTCSRKSRIRTRPSGERRTPQSSHPVVAVSIPGVRVGVNRHAGNVAPLAVDGGGCEQANKTGPAQLAGGLDSV